MELPFSPAITSLGLYTKNPETPAQKNVSTPVFIAVFCTVAKIWKQPRCASVGEWMKKLWCIYTVEYYSVVKKNKF